MPIYDTEKHYRVNRYSMIKMVPRQKSPWADDMIMWSYAFRIILALNSYN